MKIFSSSNLAGRLDNIHRILIRVLITIFFGSFAYITYMEFERNPLIIEAFEVPEQLREQGYTGRALANKLLDKITLIKETAGTSRAAQQFLTSGTTDSIDVEIAGASFSMRSILRSIKEATGYPEIQIVGEVTQGAGDQLDLTIRVMGKSPATFSGTLTGLDKILLEAAEHIYRHTDPFTLAAYVYHDKERQIEERRRESLKIIKMDCLQHRQCKKEPWTYNLWGIILRESGKNQAAIAKYQQAIDRDPNFAQAYYNWGVLLHSENKFEEARAKYQQAIEVNPNFARAYFGLGNILYNEKKYEEAIARYQQATELDPIFVLAYYNWGLALNAQGEYDEAIVNFEQVVELNPSYALGYCQWGRALYHQKNYEGAIIKYQQAIEFAPEYFWTYYYLGLAYQDSGQKDEATKAFEQVLRSDDPDLVKRAERSLDELAGLDKNNS